MSQSNQPETPVRLSKLPIDVLLKIFDDCDVADILNLALTCKELRMVTDERHVWLTQFKRRCTAFRQAPLHSRTKELYLHSTLQLKSWAIQQARLDTLWIQNEDANDNITFQNVHINDPREIRYSSTILLPGGEHLVVFTSEKEFILKKIEEGNDVGHSGLLLTDVARYSPSGSGHVDHFDKVFTDTICEYPLVAYHDKGNASITILRLDHDSGTISVQRRLQVNPRGGVEVYRMRYLAIRGDSILWFYRDGTGRPLERLVVAKLDDPEGVATRHFNLDWGVLTTRSSNFEVLTADAFLRYDYDGIHLYHIPRLSSETQPQGGNDSPPTPSAVWSYFDDGVFHRYGGLYYDRTDAVLPNFYLHNDKSSHIIEFGMDTSANTKHDPYIEYPVILNHIVTPINDFSISRIRFHGAKGRKGAHLSARSATWEFRAETVLVDKFDRYGHFCADLRRCEVSNLGECWVEAMDYDEVTGKILLRITGEYEGFTWGPFRLLLGDPSRS